MHEYEIRRGHYENVAAENLKRSMNDFFGGAVDRDGKLLASYGGLKEFWAWPGEKGKTLCVETKMDPSVDNETAQKTIKAYNAFLEQVTGYNAKERGKRAQKAAKDGKL